IRLSSCFYASPKNLVPMKFAGGIWRRHDHAGTEDGEIPIRLASSDMISASHANYHSQTRARSQLPTDLPDVEQLLRNRPPRKVAKFSSVSRNLTLNQMPSRRILHRD